MPAAPTLPYARLNLRTNPFRALDESERPGLAVVEVERWVRLLSRRLADPTAAPLALQLLGPSGCGKTTHLEALRRHFPRASLIAWSVESGWPPFPAGPLLFVDDGHHLPPGRWRGVGRCRVLVVATQEDLTPRLPGRGTVRLRPPRGVETVRIARRVTRDRVRRIVARRLEWARRDAGTVPEVERTVLDSLLDRHGADVRGLFGDLYDHVQTRLPGTP